MQSNGSCCEMYVPVNWPHCFPKELEPKGVVQGDKGPPCFYSYLWLGGGRNGLKLCSFHLIYSCSNWTEVKSCEQRANSSTCWTFHPLSHLFISDSQLKVAVDVAHQFWWAPFLRGLPETFCLRDLLFQHNNWLWCIRPLINIWTHAFSWGQTPKK